MLSVWVTFITCGPNMTGRLYVRIPFIPALPDGYQWVMFLFFPPSPHCFLLSPERRHGSTRVPGHVFLAWRGSWRMVVYIYYITGAGNSISSQLGSSCQGNRCGTEKAEGTAVNYVQILPARSLSSLKPDGPPCWVSPLAFALIGCHCPICPLPSLPSSLIGIYYILPTLFSRK